MAVVWDEHGAAVVIGIGQLRGDARNYVERVVSGETFEITRRGVPVARLEPVRDPHLALSPVSLADLRNRAAGLLDRIAVGETIPVGYRGKVVAALQPCSRRVPAKPCRTQRRSGDS